MNTHRPQAERRLETVLTRRAAQKVAVDGLTANTQLFSGRCVFLGWAIVNTGGSPVNIEFFDGQDTKGESAGAFRVAASADDHEFYGSDGVLCETGLFMVIPAAGLIGAVYYLPVVDDTPY